MSYVMFLYSYVIFFLQSWMQPSPARPCYVLKDGVEDPTIFDQRAIHDHDHKLTRAATPGLGCLSVNGHVLRQLPRSD